MLFPESNLIPAHYTDRCHAPSPFSIWNCDWIRNLGLDKVENKSRTPIKCPQSLASLIDTEGKTCHCLAYGKTIFTKLGGLKSGASAKHVSLRMKILVHRTTACSIIPYGADAWAIKTWQIQYPQVFGMWCLCTVKRVTWSDKFKTEALGWKSHFMKWLTR